jgi:hypothetical protein
MESKKEIRYDSPEAAQFKTGITGWVSSDGRFFGNDEHLARYAGCTHVLCSDCQAPAAKPYMRCDTCRRKFSVDSYAKLPFEEWDKEKPICLYDGHNYFFSEEELIDFLEDNELRGSDVMLVICDPIKYRQIDYGYWGDEAHEDWEPGKELVEAVEKLNGLLRKLPPHSWQPGKIRTSYEYTPDSITT